MITRIQKATLADAPTIAQLGTITFTETFGHLFGPAQQSELADYLATTFATAKISSSIAKENNVFWLAYANDKPVGYAKLKLHSIAAFSEEPLQAQLQKIYVAKDYIGHKIGAQLQNTLIAAAQDAGKKELWLSVFTANQRALQFYKKHGFTSIGNHNFSIGSQDFSFIALSKPL